MGDGCIDIKTIRGWVEDAGFRGFNEVEVFSGQPYPVNLDPRVRLTEVPSLDLFGGPRPGRLPRLRSQLPMIVSDSPPTCPSAHTEYESAVSTKVPPAAAKASSTANEACSSAVQPNTLPPRHRRDTSRSLVPSFVMSRS